MPEKKLTSEKVIQDFKRAAQAKRSLMARQKEDFEFALGKQWKEEDERELERRGVKALTINKTRTKIRLLTGLERQNRTDWVAFPEGEEDSIAAEIATRLLKNAWKTSDFGFKSSDAFEDAATCGESYLELWLDSTFNLLTPKPRWKKINFDSIFIDPESVEYDLSDARFVYKLTRDLSKEDLISLFPEKEKKIKSMTEGKLDFTDLSETGEDRIQVRDYPTDDGINPEQRPEGFDLLERQYKKHVKRFFIADMVSGELTEAEGKEEAENFVKAQIQVDPQNEKRFRVIERSVPEIWVYATTGHLEEPLSDERAWFYPNWKTFGFIPYYADKANAPLTGTDRKFNIQGIVSPLRGPQEELNKRRTQELRHLNSNANSGWLTPKGSWVDRSKVEQFGSTPGVNLEYDPEKGRPERIFPNPLSTGHTAMAAEHTQDMKEISGMNEDLLALQDGGSDSGRAIALRQRQGLVMVQVYFDNISRSKQMAGRLMLSQLSEIYDERTAMRVLGQSYIQKTFGRQVQDPQTGQTRLVIDQQRLIGEIRRVLNANELQRFDVAVGESAVSETMRLANFAETQQMAQLLLQIPPQFGEIIVDQSNLPEATKRRFLSTYEAARQAAQQEAEIQKAEASSAPTAAAIANQNNRQRGA